MLLVAGEVRMADEFDDRAYRVPAKVQLPTAQQVAAVIAILSLAGPMMMGGIPIVPITIYDEQRRQQDEIQQIIDSDVGIYQTSQEAQVGLTVSQQRLARVTREVDDIKTHDVTEQDVYHAAHRVLSGEIDPELSGRFRTALSHVVTDSVDLFILEDNEEFERTH